MTVLRVSVTFVNGLYHGRGDHGQPEWPPAPMRLFQALLAVAAMRWREPIPDRIASALDWLAGLDPPHIDAPAGCFGVPYQASVPHNAMDIVAKAWSRGNETGKDAMPSTHKAMKQIRPTHVMADDDRDWMVSYCWPLDPNGNDGWRGHVEVLRDLASRLFVLGWGVDLVAGHAELLDELPPSRGERWSPTSHAQQLLRTPRPAARRLLQERHAAFLKRVSGQTLIPVPRLSEAGYWAIPYRRAWDPPPAHVVSLKLLNLDGTGFRPFDLTGALHVAAMLRHAAAQAGALAGWPADVVQRLVLGHGEDPGSTVHQPVGRDRLAYVPLPSLERRRRGGMADHVGMIRRVLLVVPAGGDAHRLEALGRILAGRELVREGDGSPQALLAPLPAPDSMVRRYLPEGGATEWSTVTPVILPGRDDRREKKTLCLLRKAVRQAGYSAELAEHAEIGWQPVGYWPGADHAQRYRVPEHLSRFPRYHVRVRWRTPAGQPVTIPGPLVLGGGRFSGLGLFAAERS